MTLDVQQTLAELVAIPSLNPMGRPLGEPPYLETRVGDYLVALFQRLGVPCVRQTIHPGRDNVVARLDGQPALSSGGKLLLWDAHQDTVPVEGMTIEPWTPTVRDGRMYGRGSCDIKGGLSAMLAAFARLTEQPAERRATIVMACSVNEEHGFSGASGVCQLWMRGNDSLIPRQPDACIVAEPTSLDVVVAHKGVVRWRCHTLGRAAHSSRPEHGENAIFAMADVLRALQTYQADVAPRLGEHPLCGHPTLSVGVISGGLSVNTVPDRCTIEIDRRLLPAENPQTARQHVIDFVAQHVVASRVQHDAPMMSSGGMSDANNGSLAARLAAIAQQVSGRGKILGVPFGTNATAYSAAGVPTVVFGPGSIAQAHTADEWLPLDELHQAAEILFCCGLLE